METLERGEQQQQEQQEDQEENGHSKMTSPVSPRYVRESSNNLSKSGWNLGSEKKTPFAKMATNWAIHEISTLCDDSITPLVSSSTFETSCRRVRIPQIDPSHIWVQDTLGQGGFSSVLKVSIDDPTQQTSPRILALKRLRPYHHRIRSENDLVKSVSDLTQEIALLSRLDHENIIQVQGVCHGSVSESFVNGRSGFFFTMNVLEETLEKRLGRWRKAEKEFSGRLRRFSFLFRRRKEDASVGQVSRQQLQRRKSSFSYFDPRNLTLGAGNASRRSSLASAAPPQKRGPFHSGFFVQSPSSMSFGGSAFFDDYDSTVSAPFTAAGATASTSPSSSLTPQAPPSLLERLKQVALPMSRAMRYLHDNNILWRDLKPANIGFDVETGKLQLFDFGLSRSMDDDSLRRSSGQPLDVAGTYAYMAPETVMGIKCCAESDVYSFGVVLYELSTLRSPFPRSLRQNKAKFKEKVVIGGWRPSVQSIPSRPLRRLIDVCWDVRPRSRPSFHRIWFLLTKIVKSLENDEEQQLKQHDVLSQKDHEAANFSGIFKAKRQAPTKLASAPPRQTSDATTETAISSIGGV